jgi:hypothetical protein
VKPTCCQRAYQHPRPLRARLTFTMAQLMSSRVQKASRALGAERRAGASCPALAVPVGKQRSVMQVAHRIMNISLAG